MAEQRQRQQLPGAQPGQLGDRQDSSTQCCSPLWPWSVEPQLPANCAEAIAQIWLGSCDLNSCPDTWRYTNAEFRQVAPGLPRGTSTSSSSGADAGSGIAAARSSLRLVNRRARAIVDEWPRVIHIAAAHEPDCDGLVAAAPRLASAAHALRIHISSEHFMVDLAAVLPLLGFKNLISLSLYTNEFEDVDPHRVNSLAECLPLFPRLQRLEIDLDNFFMVETHKPGVLVNAAARHLPELRSLSLGIVDDDGSRALRDALSSRAWPHLQELCAGCLSREAAEALVACPAGLTALALPLLTATAYGAALRALGAAAAVGQLRCLRQLLLLFGYEDEIMLTVEDVRALRGVELPALESLVVHKIGQYADKDPATHLAAMRLPRLRRLKIDVCSFEAAAALAAAPWMAGVEELAIFGDSIVSPTGHWLKVLAAVPLPSLRVLRIRMSPPIDQTFSPRFLSQRNLVRVLAHALWLPRLTGLRLKCEYSSRDEASAQRAWAALAAAPLHSLRRLAVADMFEGLYSTRDIAPCAAMMRAAVVGVERMAAAGWLPQLDALELPQDYKGALATAARRFPTFEQLQARGALRFGAAKC